MLTFHVCNGSTDHGHWEWNTGSSYDLTTRILLGTDRQGEVVTGTLPLQDIQTLLHELRFRVALRRMVEADFCGGWRERSLWPWLFVNQVVVY